MARITVVSFGYLHGTPPDADIVVDLRRFRDPHAAAHLRHLTGHDQQVRDAVLATPGLPDQVRHAVRAVRWRLGRGDPTVTLAFGCAGGRHRSPVAAIVAAAQLGTTPRHRDITKPVIRR